MKDLVAKLRTLAGHAGSVDAQYAYNNAANLVEQYKPVEKTVAEPAPEPEKSAETPKVTPEKPEKTAKKATARGKKATQSKK